MAEVIPAEPGHDYAALFTVERDRLSELLAGLSAEDWQRPTPCPGWSVLGLRWAYPYRLAQAQARSGDTVTITVTGPVSRTWHLVATDAGWRFGDQPEARAAAALALSTDQAWRLLTNNLPADDRAALGASGDAVITDILLHTRAIVGAPTWA